MVIVGAKAGIATVVQLTSRCLKISRKFFSPSKHSSKDLERLSSVLYSLNSFVTNLQTHHPLHEDIEIRLLAFSHLEKPLMICREALRLIEIRLNSMSLFGKQLTRARFDSMLNKAMDIFTGSKFPLLPCTAK